MQRFDGKRVLITGGTSGIGLAGARMIAAEGGRVALTGTNARRLAEAREVLPAGSLVIENDAGDPAAAVALADAVKSDFGGLEALWLNAGFGAFADIGSVTAEMFDQLNEVNVRGPVLQMAQLESLLSDGASVVLTASTAPYLKSPRGATYAATKAALRALTRAWAGGLAARNIRVNTLGPGPIETAFFDEIAPDEETLARIKDMLANEIPLRRFGTPEEAAQVALFLLSDQSSFVTGAEYMVDGGMTMP